MNNEEFWNRTKQLIKSENLTQEILAKTCQISFATLQSWIFNKRLPDAEQAQLIAAALHTTVEYLVTGKESPDPKYLKLKQDIQRLLDNQ